ncbi:MAG TPA: helix-turn-helix transcriptional regulator [Candidatus Nesterenkonia stercoripullorum]|uniref:Helix-turn-helix transcriptional regulator n=1 Tax=Candidatus Nesterenkonia stercoripullorum TaxID=2838701 RepID=A0A9D2A9I1_9MICC|nr:helix-turn-helix transcriptional regulator [Candidatus Nesterenkonia stercoripullorum]
MRWDESAKQLGAHLRSWRIMLGLSQQLAADRARISVPALRRVENGDPGVSLGTIMKLTDVLRMDDQIVKAVDPLNHDLGRARAHMLSRKRAQRS